MPRRARKRRCWSAKNPWASGLPEASIQQLIPAPVKSWEPVELTLEELEVLKLVDYEGLTQLEASEKLGISRAKVWRLLRSGRKKLMQALLEGRPLKIVE